MYQEPAGKIYHIKSPSLPHLRFEWHPGKNNVYLIRTGTTPEIAEIVAFNIATHGDALNALLVWHRGYAEGATPGIKPHLAT